MTGFFTPKQTESKSRPDGRVRTCHSCGMYKHVKSPRMKPYGNFKRGILNIGEAPGEIEDRNGRPWQGKTGKLLEQTYEKLGMDLFEDCLNINACWCRPIDGKGNNRTPTNDEIVNCRNSTLKVIQEYRPKVIVLFGNSAVYSLLGHRWKKDLGGITKWRGWAIPDQDFQAWVCPTYHPSFVERSMNDTNRISNHPISVEQVIWEQDLQQAITYIDKPFLTHIEPTIEIIQDLSLLNYETFITQIFGSVKVNTHPKLIAFDYETTGLKPHAPGHRIVCCAVAISENHVYVFMMPETRSERKPFVDMLADCSVKKIAHNMKYEEAWSTVRLGQSVEGWEWDSMQMAHILDNRQGVTGLKFQVYVNFGIVDYSSEISTYLEADDHKNANAINRIYQLLEKPGGKEKLMKYCAYDAVYEYRLAKLQKSMIS